MKVLFLMLSLVSAAAQEQTEVEEAAIQSFKVAPSFFVPNTASQKTGKLLLDDAQVSAFVQTQNGRVMFTPSGAVIGMSVPVEDFTPEKADARERARDEGRLPEELKTRSVVMKAGFSAAHAKTRQMAPRLEEPTASIVNYMVGPKEDWRTEIPTYRKLVYENVWQGITLEYLGYMDRLQFQLVLEPGSDPQQIVLETGCEQLELMEDGRLSVTLAGAELILSAPKAFQDINGVREAVTVTFEMLDNKNIGFSLGAYAPGQTLVFSSALTWSTFLGGSAGDAVSGIAVDSSGSVYVSGDTSSTNFPTTSGAYDESYNGPEDVFVSKLNSSGTALSYSTFLGGAIQDLSQGIAVDSSGNAYVAGVTNSTDYPTTSGAYNELPIGLNEAFVTKLNATGTALSYSTYIGGSRDDICRGIALDPQNNAYILGYTRSTDYPTTSGAVDESHNGGWDVFVSKLNNTGAALSYSTLLGGSVNDRGYEITVDPHGNAYVIGSTLSANYPTTSGAYDDSHNGGQDVLVSKLNNTGTALSFSTLLGGSMDEIGTGIAVDSQGNTYVAGGTISTDYPTTSGAYDESHNGGFDAFVSKLDSSGATLNYSTVLGGPMDDLASKIAVDSGGNAYFTGEATSTDYPTTSGAYDASHNGGGDVIVSKLDSSGTTLSYSTFFGGSMDDSATAMVLDTHGNAYIAGHGESTDYPTTSGAYDESHNGAFDVYVTKISFCAIQLPSWPESLTILDIITCL